MRGFALSSLVDRLDQPHTSRSSSSGNESKLSWWFSSHFALHRDRGRRAHLFLELDDRRIFRQTTRLPRFRFRYLADPAETCCLRTTDRSCSKPAGYRTEDALPLATSPLSVHSMKLQSFHSVERVQTALSINMIVSVI